MSEIKTWIDKRGIQWAIFTGEFNAHEAIERIRKYLSEEPKTSDKSSTKEPL